ncbi:MFS transporter [Mycetocola spongiae]|uniref:MFS transporter n=1 Tax=Mycetocola spongiae TaxID=2859226 RepID=UPI001CF44188|nr:MFS transporter [Mycetocola spongiae]UCR87900.1 MFS transporter [Mycetocola spongiae]
MSGSSAGIWRQPKSVWAVAFACVIAFMGIGLVDPILPVIAADLDATPTQTEMLFTSYLLITGLAMFFTSWISSRIGAKRTLLVGLVIIVIFALAAALAGGVNEIIGFRAGWGLGNALFISTALATIVGAASGGTGSAIILYEAALGVGIAIGPLVGGLLGSLSWRGPFFGTAALMAVGFIAIVVLLDRPTEKPQPVKLSAPFRALGQPALALLAVAALFYNIAFFVMLAYSPFPLGLTTLGLGFTFFGWGLALALTSVLGAPLLTAHLRRTRVLWLVLALLAADLIAAGLLVDNTAGLIVTIIIGGLILGIANTVLTECVMEATDLPRAVASSSYSAIRFLGGAAAPPAAAEIALLLSPGAPYFVAAGSALVALLIVVLGRRALDRVDIAHEDTLEVAEAIGLGES